MTIRTLRNICWFCESVLTWDLFMFDLHNFLEVGAYDDAISSGESTGCKLQYVIIWESARWRIKSGG